MSWTNLSFFVLLSAATGVGQQLDCGKVSPVPATVTEGSGTVQAASDFLKGAFPAARMPPISASLKANLKLQQHEVLSHFPNADRLALRQYELFLTCQALNADSRLTTSQKIRYIREVGEGIDLPNPASPSSSVKKPAGKHGKETQSDLRSKPEASQVMTNSPGGIQALGDVTVLQAEPKPTRIIRTSDELRALAVLKVAPKGTRVYIMSYPANLRLGSETDNFTEQLLRLFSMAGWSTYREQNVVIGLYTDGQSHGEGIGCTAPLSPNKQTELAMKALEIIHFPCAHGAVSDPEHDMGRSLDYALYISVGKILPQDE